MHTTIGGQFDSGTFQRFANGLERKRVDRADLRIELCLQHHAEPDACPC